MTHTLKIVTVKLIFYHVHRCIEKNRRYEQPWNSPRCFQDKKRSQIFVPERLCVSHAEDPLAGAHEEYENHVDQQQNGDNSEHRHRLHVQGHAAVLRDSRCWCQTCDQYNYQCIQLHRYVCKRIRKIHHNTPAMSQNLVSCLTRQHIWDRSYCARPWSPARLCC